MFETKTIVEERTEAYHQGQQDERQKIIKAIEKMVETVELAGYEDNEADASYHNALLNVLEAIRGEKNNGK